MSQRASFEELLEFANKVRAAGGGNPLDALMPSVPADATQCLIAKNLNFNCEVSGSYDEWTMYVEDPVVGQRIADSLDLDWHDYNNLPGVGIKLPPEIGRVAQDFDDAGDIFEILSKHPDERDEYSPEQLALADEFRPYIQASINEAHDNATKVNPDGSIVL